MCCSPPFLRRSSRRCGSADLRRTEDTRLPSRTPAHPEPTSLPLYYNPKRGHTGECVRKNNTIFTLADKSLVLTVDCLLSALPLSRLGVRHFKKIQMRNSSSHTVYTETSKANCPQASQLLSAKLYLFIYLLTSLYTFSERLYMTG